MNSKTFEETADNRGQGKRHMETSLASVVRCG